MQIPSASPSAQLTKEHPLFENFTRLYCRLSPENLYCDGEISRADARRRLAAIQREWKRLENAAGFAVTECDVSRLI
jgi:hypothetical protein